MTDNPFQYLIDANNKAIQALEDLHADNRRLREALEETLGIVGWVITYGNPVDEPRAKLKDAIEIMDKALRGEK